MKEKFVFMLWLVATAGVLLWIQPVISDAWKTVKNVPIGSFPMQAAHSSGKVTVQKKAAYGDYTLITQQFMPEIFLVNMKGKILYRWRMPVENMLDGDSTRKQYDSWLAFEDAYAYPNGDLLVLTMLVGVSPYGYRLFKIDKHSNLLWTHTGNIHHDIFISKDTGNIYTLRHDFVDTVPSDIPFKRGKALADYIQVLSQDGELLDEISLFEAFSGTKYAKLLKKYSNKRSAWDITHANSVFRLDSEMAKHFPQFKVGALLVSVRNINALAVIDPDTRKVVWLQDQPWKLQHDAKFVNNGNILLFDNLGSQKRNKEKYRILEVNPKTRQVQLVYPRGKRQGAENDHFGRVDRLPNGNTLITDSLNHRVLEINDKGAIVWNYKLMLPQRKTIKVNGSTRYHAIRSATRYTKDQLPFLKQ